MRTLTEKQLREMDEAWEDEVSLGGRSFPIVYSSRVWTCVLRLV
jgi:hypothetical protein